MAWANGKARQATRNTKLQSGLCQRNDTPNKKEK